MKSHTFEESGAHLRISFWHLLMNFEKPEKWEFWKNGKTKLLEIIILHEYQKPQSYEVQFLRHRVRQNFFFHFVPFFALLPPTPLTTQKTKILKKMKKASGDVIILNLCNKKHNHMMYAYSDMEWDRHNFLSF